MNMSNETGTGKNEEMEREGWIKRSILDEPRLTEVAEMYRSIGFEVAVLPLELNSMEGCTSCLDGSIGRYCVVYTRDREGAGHEDDLFR